MTLCLECGKNFNPYFAIAHSTSFRAKGELSQTIAKFSREDATRRNTAPDILPKNLFQRQSKFYGFINLRYFIGHHRTDSPGKNRFSDCGNRI